MNIIHMDSESYELLCEWKDENYLLIKSVAPYNKCFFEKVKLDFGMYPDKETGKPMVAYFEKEK